MIGTEPDIFGERRLQPYADLMNDKNRLGYIITDAVDAFCRRHDVQKADITVKCSHVGCWVELNL